MHKKFMKKTGYTLFSSKKVKLALEISFVSSHQ
jgi:hypothetical protein